MIEAHFGVPMAGAVLNALNTRLDVASMLFMLRHGEAKVLIVDTEYAEFAHRAALEVPGLAIVSVADAMPADPARFPRRSITRRSSPAAIPRTPGRRRPTNGRRSR